MAIKQTVNLKNNKTLNAQSVNQRSELFQHLPRTMHECRLLGDYYSGRREDSCFGHFYDQHAI